MKDRGFSESSVGDSHLTLTSLSTVSVRPGTSYVTARLCRREELSLHRAGVQFCSAVKVGLRGLAHGVCVVDGSVDDTFSSGDAGFWHDQTLQVSVTPVNTKLADAMY